MRNILWILLLIVFAGCGFSVRESMIRSQRPDSLKSYSGGPISNLTEKDMEEAIAFGKANKNKQEVINYAFMFAKDTSNLLTAPSRVAYVLICTNYYLIADYAAKQTRNYEDIDKDYVNFLANLTTFKLEAMEQMGSVWYPVQVGTKSVLLKDGDKVEEAKDSPLYKGSSPYAMSHISGQGQWQESINEAMQKNMEMANKIAASYQKDLNIDTNALIPTQIKNIYGYKNIAPGSKYQVVIIYPDREEHVSIDLKGIK